MKIYLLGLGVWVKGVQRERKRSGKEARRDLQRSVRVLKKVFFFFLFLSFFLLF